MSGSSGSLTVIGGHTGSTLTGLVNIPSGFNGSDNSPLQSILTSISGAVTALSANFTNLNVANEAGSVSASAGIGAAGVFDISNTNSNGSVVGGNTAIQVTIPSGYNSLVVQAPGTATVTGNGSSNSFVLFGLSSDVTYTDTSGNGTVYSAAQSNVVVGGTSRTIVEGSVGGGSFAVFSDTGAVTTEGGSNLVFVAGQSDSVVSHGSNDIIASDANSGSITVSGFANYIGIAGTDTITAVGTGSIVGFIDTGYAGKLDFINNSSSASTITGFSGSVTVFAGAGGGHYEGGALGYNSLVGGTGIVTLLGSAAGNDTLIAAASTSGNQFNALEGSDAIESGGNQTLISESTAGSTLFTLNAGNDQVSAAGSGTQYFFLSDTGNATITASNNASVNQFFLTQASTQGGNSDLIENFSLSRDNFLLANSQGVTISGVANNQALGGGNHGAIVSLSNGTNIKLLNVSFTQNQITSVTGGSSF